MIRYYAFDCGVSKQHRRRHRESSMSKHICLPFVSEAQDKAVVDDVMRERDFLTHSYAWHPALLPTAWEQGCTVHDTYQSKKTRHRIRRVKLKDTTAVFSIRPSFLMPYGTALTDEVEKALSLLQFGVPLSALVDVFGRDEMCWYRRLLQLGRPHLVGTTVKAKEKLPIHLVADAKHSWMPRPKVFIPTTLAHGVFLGATLVTTADTEALTTGYQEFQREARQLDPQYQPATVCTDGCSATRKAWRAMFPAITLGWCLLHLTLTLRDRCRGA